MVLASEKDFFPSFYYLVCQMSFKNCLSQHQLTELCHLDYILNVFLNPYMQQLLQHSMDLEYNMKMSFKFNGLQACEGDKTLYLIDLCKCGQLQIKKSSLAPLKFCDQLHSQFQPIEHRTEKASLISTLDQMITLTIMQSWEPSLISSCYRWGHRLAQISQHTPPDLHL